MAGHTVSLRPGPEGTASAGSAPLRVRTGREDGAAALLDDRWDALVARQSVPNPTLTTAWLRELLAFGGGVSLVVVVEAGEALVGGAACRLRRPAGRFGPAVAHWIGGGYSLLSPDLLVDPDYPGAAGLLVGALLEEAPLLHFCSSPSDGPLGWALREHAPWSHVTPDFDGWIVPLPPPKVERVREKVGYELRRARRSGASDSVAVAEGPDDVAAFLERLFVLHEERWRGRPEALPLFGTTEAERALYRRLVGALAALGKVRVAEVTDDGVLVASCLGLLHGRGALFHKTASRGGGQLRSPGHVALLAVVEAATAAGAVVMDLGQGSADPGSPKARLGPTARPFATFLAARTVGAQRALQSAIRIRARIRAVARSARSR